ncbi:HAMP domain-containing protein, partial [Patescibacteria group bacterium]
MKKWRDFSISFKILFLATILAFVFLGGGMYFVISGVKVFFNDILEENYRNDVELNAANLSVLLDDIGGDIISLSQAPPVQGIIRAKDSGNNFDSEGDSSLEQWEERLEDIFSSIAQSKGFYSQVRYLDEFGQEMIRVNYDGENVEVIEEDNLQNKKDRDYFSEAIVYPQGKIYSSEINLNKEGTPPIVEVPYQPVIRYATTIFDNNETNRGMLVVNVDFEKALEKVNITRGASDDVVIIDHHGDYLFHKKREKEWGGENSLRTGENFNNDFSQEIVSEVFSRINGSMSVGGEQFFYSRVYMNKDDPSSFLFFMKNVPISVVFKTIDEFITQSAFTVGAIFIALFFVFHLLISRILSPLKGLLTGVEGIGRGNFSGRVEIKSNDEIGLLAKSFNNMAEKLGDLYYNLEKRVEDRTLELRRINSVMMGRESRIVELKDENKRLKDEKISSSLSSH